MKEEKFKKALKIHQDKLYSYGEELHDIVDAMLKDSISPLEVIGMLEAKKLSLFDEIMNASHKMEQEFASLDDVLEELRDMLEGEDE